MIHRYFIEISYKGTAYHGWQVQPNAKTVQEVLSADLGLILGEPAALTGCGRTDTGVHASKFYAHFDSALEDLAGSEDVLFRLNGKLPPEISVRRFIKVTPEAHARFDALSRTYEYNICRQKEVFNRDYAHYVYGAIDTSVMQEAARILMEYSDFTSFSKVDTDVKTNLCSITGSEWEISDTSLVFRITADRFLRGMVRAITGTMLEIGFGKMSPAQFRKVIESRDRSNAGTTAPAKGLFLTDIVYPDSIFI